MILASQFIQFPGGAKWSIGFVALFHTAVGSLAIGFAFVVTILQIIGYRRKDPKYDLLAQRIQLWHVCVYNIGTINAIGLVFLLSGLYPQFWSQVFVHFFWTLIVEELLFFLLATTVTFHYFFWDRLWGHKKLHIFLGALMNPLFFLQFLIINGMGAFMLTPGFSKNVSQWSGTHNILGWDKLAFYNPSFLMLTFHRTMANFAYGAFVAAAVWGVWLYRTRRPRMTEVFETGARILFYVGFFALLSLPVIGYGYAHVLKYHGKVSYTNLMWGKGDVVAGGIDWWWVKHLIVPSMLGMGIAYFRRMARLHKAPPLAMALLYALTALYVCYYAFMGMIMTWLFFWASLGAAVIGGLLATHLLNYHKNSGRGVYVLMGVLSFLTVCLGGYVREASRARFVSPSGERVAGQNRIAPYDRIYVPRERASGVQFRNVLTIPDYVPQPSRTPPPYKVPGGADLVSEKCVGCHTLRRVWLYPHDDWRRVSKRMRAYGVKLSEAELDEVVKFFREGGHLQPLKDEPEK